MMISSEARIDQAEDFARLLTALLLRYPAVLGVGAADTAKLQRYFEPYSAGAPTLPVAGVATAMSGDSASVVIFTTQENIRLSAEFRSAFSGFALPVETRYTGAFRVCASGGDSLGYGVSGGATGTLGRVIRDGSGDEFVLSCNHVIANENGGSKYVDPVWSPGAGDGGTSANRIGVLWDFEHVQTGGMLTNEMDAAIGKLDTNSGPPYNVRTIGPVTGVEVAPPHNLRVQKHGYTSKHTRGELTFKNMSLKLPFAGGQALFVNQYGLVSTNQNPFAENGDSGALVLNHSGEAVGLIMAVAGTGEIAVANPIEQVLTRFGVSF